MGKSYGCHRISKATMKDMGMVNQYQATTKENSTLNVHKILGV